VKPILLDINVVLDVLLAREPYLADALRVFSAVEAGHYEAWLSAHAITTIHYLCEKHANRNKATTSVRSLLTHFRVAAVNENSIRNALNSEISDFEDAVTVCAAKEAGAAFIITRNIKDFRKSDIPAILPVMLLTNTDNS
jgi:predicted nucleic acid-binding protein